MPDNHIHKMLDERPFSSLSDRDITSAESHIATCGACKAAYEAAKVAASLIQTRADETVGPGPFFRTRVIAAIRERRLTPDEPALVRVWKAAGALISAMALLLVILTGATIFTRNADPSPQAIAAAANQNLYSAEYVVLERGDLDDGELEDDQVLGTMYDLEVGDGQ